VTSPIPTTLLCGFLGSGKTTRINRLIADGAIADALFLVNDFGRINIDAELIESRDDAILRLTNGCACCGIASNVSAQLRDICAWPKPPAELVFEASGIAEPRPLMQLLDAARGYRLAHAETLVDASAFASHHADTAINDIVVAQIREVSHLRINRADWLSSAAREQVIQDITRLNKSAELIIEASGQPPPRPAMKARTHKADSAGTLVTRSVTFGGPVDIAAAEALLQEATPALIRAKGLLQAIDETCYVVQLAGGRLALTASRARATRALVLIGHDSDAMAHLVTSLRQL